MTAERSNGTALLSTIKGTIHTRMLVVRLKGLKIH